MTKKEKGILKERVYDIVEDKKRLSRDRLMYLLREKFMMKRLKTKELNICLNSLEREGKIGFDDKNVFLVRSR